MSKEKTTPPTRKPRVGDSVHLTTGNGYPLAAVIAFVHPTKPGLVNLAYFDEGGVSNSHLDVPYSEEPRPGCWSWPQE